MKKVLTLLACICLTFNSFSQEEYKKIVTDCVTKIANVDTLQKFTMSEITTWGCATADSVTTMYDCIDRAIDFITKNNLEIFDKKVDENSVRIGTKPNGKIPSLTIYMKETENGIRVSVTLYNKNK